MSQLASSDQDQPSLGKYDFDEDEIDFLNVDTTTCLVCDEKLPDEEAIDKQSASRNHTGLFCCQSCRSFFARCVQADKWHLLTCVNGKGECDVSGIARRDQCASCRFEKCVFTGMRVEYFNKAINITPVQTPPRAVVDPTLNLVRLDKQPPIKTYKSLPVVSEPDLRTDSQLGSVCNWCFLETSSTEPESRRSHHEQCQFRIADACLYCSRRLSTMNDYNRKTHVEHCRNKAKLKGAKVTIRNAGLLLTAANKIAKRSKQSKRLKTTSSTNQVLRKRSSPRLSKKVDQQVNTVNEVEHNMELDETLENKLSTNREDSTRCQGYKPSVDYPSGESLYSNFPFQALDNDRDNLKFVIENGTFHNVNCYKKDYKLVKDCKNGVNRLCADLAYHRYLQNILKRSQITCNFSSIPHQYLTYSQLKKELNHYRDSIKKLKLDNLNLKRTIDSARAKEESYKRFLSLLGANDYSKLSQIITVCLNQKKGINGIIEKLMDSTEGVYSPRGVEKDDKDSQNNTSSELIPCKICNQEISLVKMREHVARHCQRGDVSEHANRCGFCGLTDSCSIQISKKSLPVSDCPYFRCFNLNKCSKQDLTAFNRPVECLDCKQVVWSFNLKSHYIQAHSGQSVNWPSISSVDAKAYETTKLIVANESYQNSASQVPCKICSEMCTMTRMRDHVAKHIIMQDVGPSSSRCGYCGQADAGCSIDIVITSGKGRNTTYGPASNCSYFRKFNLKSSTRPTKSSPSTNRPIECHLCRQSFWSYNMRQHFLDTHAGECSDPPDLITQLEKDLLKKS